VVLCEYKYIGVLGCVSCLGLGGVVQGGGCV
jgi:hypothetical protein